MNSCHREVDGICTTAWSDLGRDLRSVGKHSVDAANAFVRERPIVAIATSVGLGVLLVSRLRGGGSRAKTAKKEPGARRAWLAAGGSLIGSALWDWGVRRMTTPRGASGAPPCGTQQN